MAVGMELLATSSIRKVVAAIRDVKGEGAGRHSRWASRVPRVPALPGEIMVRVQGRVLIADMIADDAKARVQQSLRFVPYAADTPNFKHGTHFNQSMINLLRRIEDNLAGRDEIGIFTEMRNKVVSNLLEGIQARINALAVAMMIDRGLSYDNLGIKFDSLSFGRPSVLKPTAAIAWEANPTTATPVDDISSLITYGQVQFGENWDRVEMSTSAFRAMIATTEYQNKAKSVLPASAPALSNFNTMNLEIQRNFAASVLGVRLVELVNDRYWFQFPSGEVLQGPYLPDRYVLISDSSDDGNSEAWDFAEDVVTESVLGSFAGSSAIVGGWNMAPSRGPISYATVPPDLNSPDLTFWGVDRGFTRPHRQTATASLDIGDVTDRYPSFDALYVS